MTNIKDSKVQSSDEAVNTQLWRINHDSMSFQGVTLENMEATSGIGVEAKKAIDIQTLKWSGKNIFRKNIFNFVADKVNIQDSSLVDLQIDPLQSEVLF
jgi:hypothetical protein